MSRRHSITSDEPSGLCCQRWSWRDGTLGRIFCCFCPRTRGSSPPYQTKKQLQCFKSPILESDTGVVQMKLETDAASQRSVRDLGTENPSFSITEDTALEEKRSVGRSVSSVSSSQRARQKKKLTPLSSLPLQKCSSKGGKTSLCSDEESEVLFSKGGGSLLTPPVINLIPPTPSDVIDDDQFFDINSEEESVTNTSGCACMDSAGRHVAGDQQSLMGGTDQTQASQEVDPKSKGPIGSSMFIFEQHVDRPAEGLEVKLTSEPETDKSSKLNLLWSTYQVAPLPEYPRKRSFNAGINLLQFTEQNLDDLNSKDPKTHELLKAELRLLPLSTKMDPLFCLRKPAARTCSLGDVVSRSQTFEMLRKGRESRPEEEGSPRQRRVTVASYIPQAKDQDGIYSGQLCSPGKKAKALGELDTEETCWWFTKLGLQKYIPFIRGANLRGSHIASIDLEILDLLHVSTPEDRECLLSAVYRELHPPDTTTQELDTLLETIGSYNVEKFTAALVNLSKAKSLQFSDSAKAIPCQFQFSQRGEKGLNSNIQKDSHLLEFTIKALEQKVHLRFPKEITVGKVIGTCLKMLGVAENKDLFTLNTLTGKSKEGVLNEFPPDRQVGDLIDPETTHLELLLCKKDNTLMKCCGSEEISPKVENREQADPFHSVCNQNQQTDLKNKEDKRRDLSQQVDRLQKVIYQVQGLHQSLASFCSELRDTDAEADVEGMCLSDTVVGLRQTERKLAEKELLVGTLRQRLSSLRAHTSGPVEVHLFDKMKLDCQIFMEEINIIFLNQQMARLKSAHQMCKVKARDNRTSCTLGQLLSHQPPAVLLAIQETATAGTYGFRVQLKEGSGLVVVDVGNSKLCMNDRLVEVNGVSVVDYREEELKPLLSCQSCLIVVLRRPVPFIS